MKTLGFDYEVCVHLQFTGHELNHLQKVANLDPRTEIHAKTKGFLYTWIATWLLHNNKAWTPFEEASPEELNQTVEIFASHHDLDNLARIGENENFLPKEEIQGITFNCIQLLKSLNKEYRRLKPKQEDKA